MTTEAYEIWRPLPDLLFPIYLEALHDDSEGFRLLLRAEGNAGKTLRIVFNPALSYRNTDEGDLLKMLPNIEGLGKSTLFTVRNSEYLVWFHGMSVGRHEEENIIHYAIYTPNDCVDALSAYPPIVEWLN